jgi:GDPmannose 4,6-dehydratase
VGSKVALITGISGQDGSYLSTLLLESGYHVIGLLRRQSVAENQTSRLDENNWSKSASSNIELIYADLLDESSITRIIHKYQPDEIYNLAAMSHVRISYDIPSFTIQTNSLGVLHILEAIRSFSPNSKFYQASSSEMFGNSIDPDGFQRLTTPMHPVSPYGCSKLLAYRLNVHYRQAYDLHATSGILFNHESPRRGTNFVTNKVVKGAVLIKKGQEKKLEMGNLESSRDWGHSSDYVRAMHLIMQHREARDWVVSTGETRSVRELCEYVFSKLDLDYSDFVTVNTKFYRKEELNVLKGDSQEIRDLLGWEPQYSFEMMIDEMIEYWDLRL